MPTYPFESRLWNPCVSSSKPSTPIPRAGTAVPEVRPGFGARRAGIARPYRAFSVPEPVLPNTRSRLVFEPSRRCSARHHPGTRKTSGSHPLELNNVTIGVQGFPSASDAAFRRRCDLAYGPPPQTGSASDIEWPIAIIPTHVHPRMRSQKGCFTLHGAEGSNFEVIARRAGLATEARFLEYRIPAKAAPKILRELRGLGITHCTLFPDHDGLAIELTRVFKEQGNLQACVTESVPAGGRSSRGESAPSVESRETPAR